MGEHAIDYAHVAQKEKLSELQLRVRQLLDQVCQLWDKKEKLSKLQLRVRLRIQFSGATEPSSRSRSGRSRSREKGTALILNVLYPKVEQISKEQNYQRYREERFRLTSESTNQRVLWYLFRVLFFLLVSVTCGQSIFVCTVRIFEFVTVKCQPI